MIADVAFDAPLAPFSYRVPAGWALAPGQRVLAPLRGAARVGVVVAVRPGDAPALKPLARVLDEAPLLDAEAQALVAWIAAESLTSLGATWLSLLPPVAPHGAVRAAPPGEAPSAASPGPAGVLAAARLATAPAASEPAPGPAVELLVGAAREAELAARLAGAQGALVVVPDVEAAARWAERLARDAPVGRLDSGVSDAERARAWRELAAGRLRRAVGTRAALLAPLPPGATLALVDEWVGLEAALTCTPPAEVAWGPVETVSVSEGGFERIYQGTAVLVAWTLPADAREEARLTTALTVRLR